MSIIIPLNEHAYVLGYDVHTGWSLIPVRLSVDPREYGSAVVTLLGVEDGGDQS